MRRVRQVMAGAVLLAGCGSVVKERGHAEVGQLVSERTQLRTQWEKGPPADAEVQRWVRERLRNGLTREAAAEIALANNPSLQATYEELGVSQADMVQAGLLKNPSLGGSVGINVDGGLAEGEFSLVQDILDLFVLPLRKEIAREQFMTDTLRVAQQALDVVAEVSKEFASFQSSEALVDYRRTLLETAQAGADLAARQHKAGNISDLALASERAAYEQAKVELARDEIALGQHRERLNRLLGLWGPDTKWTVPGGLPQLPAAEPPLDHLESLAMSQRLDIEAARREARLLAKGVDLARSSRLFGRIEVGLHGHRDPDGPRLVGPMLSLELPIFDQRQALIARLEAEQRRGERRLAALAINTRADVRAAEAQLRGARQVLGHYHAVLLPLRTQIVELTQQSYNGMFIGLYGLLAAKQGEIDAQRGYLEAARDYWMARADLERAVGGRLPATLAPETKGQ